MRIFKLLLFSVLFYSCTAEDPFVDVRPKILSLEVQKIDRTSAVVKGKFLSMDNSVPKISVYSMNSKYEVEPSNIKFPIQTEGTFQVDIQIDTERSTEIYIRIEQSRTAYLTRKYYYNPYTNRLDGPY